MANPISNRPSFAFQAPRGGRPQGAPGQDDDNQAQGPQRNGNADATQEGQGPGRGGGQCNRGGGDDGGDASEDNANQDRGRGPRGSGDIPQGGLESRTSFIVMQRFRGRRGGGGENTEAPPTQAAPQGRNIPSDDQIPNITGSGDISTERLSRATGGNQQIMQVLQRIAEDPQGARALSIALDKGTTFKMGQLDGNTAGITAFATGQPPAITLEKLETDVVAHEIAHAAYPDMAHEAVYEFGRQVARALGETPIT